MLAALLATQAHAECLRPAPPQIPGPAAPDSDFKSARSQISAYLNGLDSYMSCVRTEAATLKPLPAMADYREYERVPALMQQAVDSYNAALAARRTDS